MNCGFVKTERLDGNIGYMRLDVFGPVPVCGAKATEAFAALGDVDAIIFDLRDNGGGAPDMVTYVESYLFAKRTHLDDIYTRDDNKTTPSWTNPAVPGKKLATQPVYVLTAARTFSGAEAFAYDLQSAKRAAIVGEVTGGGAHPSRPIRCTTGTARAARASRSPACCARGRGSARPTSYRRFLTRLIRTTSSQIGPRRTSR